MANEQKTIIIPCRHCKEKFRMAVPSKNGMYRLRCPACGGINVVNFQIKKTKQLPMDGMKSHGCLKLVRFGGLMGKWSTKVFPLHIGMNTIGRKDDELPSDICFDHDDSMSRRSVSIEVIQKDEKGFLFKMKVLRAANPVLHNEKPLVEGEVIYLNYGDTIVLGRTKLIFERREK